MSSVLNLGDGIIMSRRDAERLVRAIEALSWGNNQGLSIRMKMVYEHFQRHEALGVLMDLQDVTKPKEETPL